MADEQLKKDLQKAQEDLKAMTEAKATVDTEKAGLEADKAKAELEAYKVTKLSTIEDKDIRADVAENLSGDSKEDIDQSFTKLKKLAEGIVKKAGSKIVLEPIVDNEKKEHKTITDVLESKDVERKDKLEILTALVNGKAA